MIDFRYRDPVRNRARPSNAFFGDFRALHRFGFPTIWCNIRATRNARLG
jgi:hypothetical protein